MNESRSKLAVPDWELERYRLSELPLARLATLRAELDRDEGARERLAELEADSRAVVATHAPRVVAAEVRRRLEDGTDSPAPRQRWRSAMTIAIPALAAAVGVGVWSYQGPPVVEPSRLANAPVHEDVTRIKGLRPMLLVFRKAGDEAEPLSPGSRARRGDVIQLAYQAAGHRYGVIVSVDGRGVVTSHLPHGGPQAAPLTAGGAVSLDSAYRLDDAPNFELFYFVAANEPFGVSQVLAAARATRTAADSTPAERLELPDAFSQSSFLLRKDVPR